MEMDFQNIFEYFRQKSLGNSEIMSKYFRETGYTEEDLDSDDGIYGEYLTYEYLHNAPGYSKILCNLYIERDNGYISEIDLIFIHETGIYIIESKNFSGWIYGHAKDQYWTQVLKDGRKYKFYNPIKQNETHLEAVLEVLYALTDKFVFNVVVFSERCELKSVTYDNLNTSVINRDVLPTFMIYETINSPKHLSKKDIDYLYDMLKPYTLASPEIKQKHKDQSNRYK
jgi:hypothetical protein